MKRTADSTIKGFLYQFNKTLLEILIADEDKEITVEGLVEDIDIIDENGDVKAIQCKYHESVERYTDSLIYKPILQMAETFSKNKNKKISFILFIHIPAEACRSQQLNKKIIENALKTENEKLKKIASRIEKDFNIDEFIKSVTIEFSKSIDDIESEVKKELSLLKLSNIDVECILYPNAINKIAKLSSLKNDIERVTTKKNLLLLLDSITVAAITRWTLALKNKTQILEKIKKQVSSGFSKNSRNRYFYFCKEDILEFNNQIVVFIDNYLKKYHFKPLHDKTPLFSINMSYEEIKDIEYRLYKKEISANTGIVGNTFVTESFFREPIVKIQGAKIINRDIDMRLLAFNERELEINNKKGDDIYFICNEIPTSIEKDDINCYQIGVSNFNELEYVLGMRGTYE
ncbi:TPA: hypothetical protein PXN84_000840 [Yersinia enterocolitica]|nr:hypothetical protein [Yersinia enterocolitica]HDL7430967.1 hypothetical protein [Yersinia enterocolitica]HDL7473412.1 hypothetical protein [Yersinia enterocolitica]